MATSTLSDETQILLNPDITFGDVDGEIIALNIETGFFLHLNSSGSYIFSLLSESTPRTLAEIYNQLGQAYNVETQTCRREVGAFIAQSLEKGLINLVS